ncbi:MULTISPECIES: DUF488 domain-containing protein [unclassified Leifsonia]|uniref:DUF488 domain-containing protein n=1 Tax=unclassified Leifsonia TaxID=2663824 RepID=UPI001FF7C59E|nr:MULTISPECIES: DUF488 domain-containing protein [unclassified Leifsonia]
MSGTRIFTIGHSTHPLLDFVGMVRAHGVETIVDVRSIPKSRHNPQYGISVLPQELAATDLGYHLIEKLGGLRHGNRTDLNGGWRNASFRAYADYMQSPAFSAGLDELISIAADTVVAIMCAEAVPWRCHRSLIADALLIRRFDIIDIFSRTNAKPHGLTSFARVDGERITYPGDDADQPDQRAHHRG